MPHLRLRDIAKPPAFADNVEEVSILTASVHLLAPPCARPSADHSMAPLAPTVGRTIAARAKSSGWRPTLGYPSCATRAVCTRTHLRNVASYLPKGSYQSREAPGYRRYRKRESNSGPNERANSTKELDFSWSEASRRFALSRSTRPN